MSWSTACARLTGASKLMLRDPSIKKTAVGAGPARFTCWTRTGLSKIKISTLKAAARNVTKALLRAVGAEANRKARNKRPARTETSTREK